MKRLNPYKVWITVGTLKGYLDPESALKGPKEPILKKKDKRGGYYG